jgi:hypothetical protein
MIPEQPRGYSIRLKPQADRILVVEPVSQFAYTLSSAPRSTPAFTVKSSADRTGRAYIVCRLSASTMTRQDSATARQDRGYSPQSYRVVLAVTRSYGSYDDATLAGFTRRVGAAFVACLITAPVRAEKRF